MMAGSPPSLKRQARDLRAAHRSEAPPSLEKLVPSVARELSRIVQKCLEKEPESPYATFAEARSDMERLLRRLEPEAAMRREGSHSGPIQEGYRKRVERCIGLSKLGKNEDALRMIEPVVKEYPENDYGWFAKGSILGELTRHSEAIAADQRALALDPDNPSVLFNLGAREITLGKEQAGRAHIERAAELGHENAKKMLQATRDNSIIVVSSGAPESVRTGEGRFPYFSAMSRRGVI